MNADVRTTFLRVARETVDLLGRKEVGDNWQEPSVLAEYDVGALSGHLARGVLTPHWYLDMPEPDPPTISAAEYFAAMAPPDASSEAEAQLRARGAEAAKGGWARLYLDSGKALDHLTTRLPQESTEHRIPSLGQALLLDEFLKAQIVELVIHTDDLARSVSVTSPTMPVEATHVAIEVLTDAGRVRHGDRAVLHALARRELDTVDALRVL